MPYGNPTFVLNLDSALVSAIISAILISLYFYNLLVGIARMVLVPILHRTPSSIASDAFTPSWDP